ncbi:MAG: FAD-dependent oxidoreductase [Selenomonadaceae bacterium]|nr:FAD-dependent oxidoreductase [Selenomonadaceae bacterium]
MEKNFLIPISRRELLKLASLTAVGVALGSDKNVEAAEPPKPQNFSFNGAQIPTLLRADVCVCGGGPSGTAAAVTAARNGLKVVLIEQGTVLGGLQTQGLVYPAMPTKVLNSDTPYITDLNKRFAMHGINVSFTDDAKYKNGGDAREYTPELLAFIYDELCADYNVEVLYNATLIGANTSGGKISAAIVHTVEGLSKIEANIFIDATGDATLSRFAGVKVERGSEHTGRNQKMSFRFEMGGVEEMKVYKFFVKKLKDGWCETKPPEFEFAKTTHTEKFYYEGIQRGEVTKDDVAYIQAFTILGKPGVMSMNCPEVSPYLYSSTSALDRSKAIRQGRIMIRRLAHFFRKNIPGFKNAYISREASMLGVRESWRIHGKYYMTGEDYFNAQKFPDAVCRSAYPIDIHDEVLNLEKKLAKGEFYEIPYRALITNEISNLIVVGRCISANFAAQAAVRIQPSCMSMGEAAGIAAAYGLKNGIAVNAVDWTSIPNRSYVSAG